MRAGWMLLLLGLSACESSGEMTAIEALDALKEVNSSARGEQATADVIEVSTDFTIGDALQAAAQTIADFWQSQAPCTTVSVSGATTTIDYGTLEDDCSWNGRTYAGVNTVSILSATLGSLEVEHTWDGFTNGDVTVDGAATVRWDGSDRTREVVTDHSWTAVDDAVTVDVHGEHISAPIDEGVPVWESGFTLDGLRDWTTEAGDWSLTMSGLELRLVDPAPQAGTLNLQNPDGKALTVVYERVDDSTIQATLSGLRGGDKVYWISGLGQVEEAP